MTNHSGAPAFPPTRWSLVFAASGEGPSATVALEELCRLYWLPLYAFARQRGLSPEDAEDETQGFLAKAASGQLFASAIPDKGRLRTFLLAVFQADLADLARRNGRQKRGGHIKFVEIDLETAERLAAPSSAGGDSDAAAAFDRAFALSCLEQTGQLLSDEFAARGRQALFGILKPFLDPSQTPDHAAAAAAAGLEAAAFRQAVFRLRQRFRTVLRQIVADTLANPSEQAIDDELAALRLALAS